MTHYVGLDRRRFLRAGLATLGFAEIGAADAADPVVEPRAAAAIGDGTAPGGFGPLKQMAAGVLNVGYAEVGDVCGRPIILRHGWPYDIHSFADVAPLLAAEGYRVLVPYLRGYATTRFLSESASRSGQQAALALDVIAFMDALGISKAIVAGFDWGARTANIVAASWPDRCQGIVAVSGYLIANREANRQPLPPQAEYAWWYQYDFATERGERGYRQFRREFSRLIWRTRLAKLAV